jgi:hypothetical protein
LAAYVGLMSEVRERFGMSSTAASRIVRAARAGADPVATFLDQATNLSTATPSDIEAHYGRLANALRHVQQEGKMAMAAAEDPFSSSSSSSSSSFDAYTLTSFCQRWEEQATKLIKTMGNTLPIIPFVLIARQAARPDHVVEARAEARLGQRRIPVIRGYRSVSNLWQYRLYIIPYRFCAGSTNRSSSW